LHERAGSTQIMHLHGEIFKMRSVHDDEQLYSITGNINMGDVDEHGHQLRPHIVWFEEAVPMMEPAINWAYLADVFVVIGSSLQVYPAASILNYLPPFMPVIVLDKKIPSIQRANVYYIEKVATKGMSDLVAKIDELLV
jgi:NAD-dependent deacetylase